MSQSFSLRIEEGCGQKPDGLHRNAGDRTSLPPFQTSQASFLCFDAFTAGLSYRIAKRCNHANQIFYVHFDHIVGETSHYFIICQTGESFIILQSAVFEFSIRDWLFPAEAIASAVEDHRLKCASLQPEELRDRFQLEQHDRDLQRNLGIFERIKGCIYSSGRVLDLKEIGGFLLGLAALEGHWPTPGHDVYDMCDMYQRVFSCLLPADVIKSKVRSDDSPKPGVFKFVSGITNITPGLRPRSGRPCPSTLSEAPSTHEAGSFSHGASSAHPELTVDMLLPAPDERSLISVFGSNGCGPASRAPGCGRERCPWSALEIVPGE